MRQLLVAMTLAFLVSGCKELDIDSVVRVAQSVITSTKEITPEQEYYVGRSVSVNILEKYKPYENAKANAYLNKIGTLMSYVSAKPDIYGGYHFLILDSDEINAFAAPGGYIFVTRGLLRCTKSEDAVAAVLAHEISHVALGHGIASIKQSRWTSTATLIASEAGKKSSSETVAELTEALGDTVSDIVNTVVVNGYSRTAEEESDKMTVRMLKKTGYNPHAIVEMLQEMDRRLKPGGIDFAKTHPDPKERIAVVKNDAVKNTATLSSRQARFKRALTGI